MVKVQLQIQRLVKQTNYIQAC